MLQVRTINKYAKKANLRLVKRNHHFIWVGTTVESAKKLMELPTNAVFAEHVNDLTLDEWLTELSTVSLKKVKK